MGIVRIWCWSLALPVLCLVGCGGGDDLPLAKRAPVEGTVSYNGQPLNAPAEIFFSVPGDPPEILAIENGKFTGQAPIGKTVRVEIRGYKIEPIMMDGQKTGENKVNYLPPAFNDMSTLTTEIPEAGKKDLKFEVADAQ